jgi:multidrug efflux system outer membrane protein
MKSIDLVHPAVRRIVILGNVLALSACAISTPAPPPPADLPPSFIESTPVAHATPAPVPDWWRDFGSNELSVLMEAALAGNPDLTIASERVRQAQAQVTIAGSSLFPSLGASAGVSHRETRSDDANASTLNASLSASYEIDLWGRNTSTVHSSEFALRATRFDQETVRLTLVSGVASAFFQVLALRDRLRLANENITIAQGVFKVVSARLDNGVASTLDLARQKSALLGQQAAILSLQLQERQTLYALAILVGKTPQEFLINGTSVLKLSVPEVGPGLPSSLLVRRPDLASAEAQLASANANVTVARAALLPSISLTGSAGLSSDSLHGLVSAPALAFSLGASLLQPLFNGGRLRAQVDIASSHERELVLLYRKAILAALAEVETALAAHKRLGDQARWLAQSQEQTTSALRMAKVRYREGADDLIVLLDAQRSLFQAQDQVVQIHQSRLQAALDLLKALGGGWR